MSIYDEYLWLGSEEGKKTDDGLQFVPSTLKITQPVRRMFKINDWGCQNMNSSCTWLHLLAKKEFHHILKFSHEAASVKQPAREKSWMLILKYEK